MIAFPDTSFLCALYVQQDNSRGGGGALQIHAGALHVSSLMLYEFRQSVRFQVWLHSRDKSKRLSPSHCGSRTGQTSMRTWTRARLCSHADWPGCPPGGGNSFQTPYDSNGHRALDVLHVATALHLSAREILTFDAISATGSGRKLNVKP